MRTQSISNYLMSVGLVALFGAGCAKSTPPAEPYTPPEASAGTTVSSTDKVDGDACVGVTVFFDTSSDEIDAGAQQRIDELATCLADKQVREIVVTGRADPQGAATNNDALSMRRAEKIVAALEARGVSTSMLLIRAYGESDASQLRVMWPYERRAEVKVSATDDADSDEN